MFDQIAIIADTVMTGSLQGKVAIVTGGSSGIGQACAARFAAEGADVVIADLQSGQTTIAEVESHGRRALFVPTDVTDERACQQLVRRAADEMGRVDVVVAAAGVVSAFDGNAESADDSLIGIAMDSFMHVLNVNLIGVMLTNRAAARQMVEQGEGGAIVNLASTACSLPKAGAGPYCVSKAGVAMVTKVLALELADFGVRVNAVAPGPVRTPMLDRVEADPRFSWKPDILPMKRVGTPEEVASTCLFLATGESSFFTGQVLFPAGGQFTG